MAALHPTFAPAPAPRRRRSSAGVAHAAAAEATKFATTAKRAGRSGGSGQQQATATRTRRFSLSSEKRTWIDAVLDRPQVFIGALITAVFVAGTLISVRWDTALSTSQLPNVHGGIVAERTAYFARKRNLVNMLFVKRAWAWTSALYLFHLLTTPVRDTNAPRTDAVPGWVNPALHVYMPNSTRRGARAQRLATLVLSSLAWIAFTSWCFGAGIGDRIIAASGGVCAVPLPAGVDAAHVHSLLGGGAQLLSAPHKHAHSPAESAIALFLPLPAKYCLHVPLTPKTHPTLFAILEAVQSVHAASHTALHLPPPRWSGGFDVSGHAFLLTLGALILAAEVAPSWRAYRARGYTQRKGSAARLHAVATVLATALVGLWVWMLFMTAVYFHDVDEKMAGLALGLATAALVQAALPRPSGPVIEFKVRGPTRRPSPMPMPVYASVSAAAADAADAADSAAAAAASKIAVAGSSNGHRHIKTPAPPVINIVEHPEPVHPFDEGEVARENGEVEAQAAAAAAAAAADAAAGRV